MKLTGLNQRTGRSHRLGSRTGPQYFTCPFAAPAAAKLRPHHGRPGSGTHIKRCSAAPWQMSPSPSQLVPRGAAGVTGAAPPCVCHRPTGQARVTLGCTCSPSENPGPHRELTNKQSTHQGFQVHLQPMWSVGPDGALGCRSPDHVQVGSW